MKQSSRCCASLRNRVMTSYLTSAWRTVLHTLCPSKSLTTYYAAVRMNFGRLLLHWGTFMPILIFPRLFVYELGACASISPRLGGTHSGQSTPPPLLSSSHSPSFSPRNGVRSHSRCGTESWTELELAFHLTVTFLIRLQGPNDSLH